MADGTNDISAAATTLRQEEAGGVRVLRLNGSLTQRGVADVGPVFSDAIATGGVPDVVVDLSAVDVIATTGITMLLVADRELKQRGGRMVLATARGLVRDVLLRCRLDKVLRIAASADEAIESVRRD